MVPPDLSVLIAAHRLHDLLPLAVASVLARAEGVAVEIVVASDDGTDYATLLPADPRLRFTAVGPVASGAHAARNRALAIATGAHVMILDGDDALEGPPDGIAQALDLAHVCGAVLVPSIVRDPGGAEVRRVPAPGARRYGFGEWRHAFSSLHLVARRDLVQPFAPFRLIDDVVFDLRALAAAGGVVPVADALAYRYQLRAGQMTDTAGARFDAEYAEALARIGADGFGFGAQAKQAARVLRRWRAMNRLVGGGGSRPALGDYHRAVAGYLEGRSGEGEPPPNPLPSLGLGN
ncbi:glycosyltransferase [Roseomonas eburnea]|uniref:Glycosyltransferase n=1 Tax=Neoroseomonas eburnea TaxID=1346889 RepID=A0A9X9XFE6_9PROT|nr:glycosyltransferase [Neoroseomonas eburnea]MBR0682432.1 glycosyltransferase [Neoroseomonas eburnea]